MNPTEMLHLIRLVFTAIESKLKHSPYMHSLKRMSQKILNILGYKGKFLYNEPLEKISHCLMLHHMLLIFIDYRNEILKF